MTNQPGATVASGRDTQVDVALRPFGVAVFKGDDPEARVIAWRTERVPDRDLEHMRGIIARTGTLLGDPRLAAALSADDRTFMTESLASAKANLDADGAARAWQTLTYWRFWTLWREKLEPAAAKP